MPAQRHRQEGHDMSHLFAHLCLCARLYRTVGDPATRYMRHDDDVIIL